MMENLTGDLKKDWNLLLSKINSFPARMMLASVAKPVQISKDKVIIAFNNENVLKQAQEFSQNASFQKVLIDVFGKLPEIELILEK